MKMMILGFLALLGFFWPASSAKCPTVTAEGREAPKRLVLIKGKAVILNLRDVGQAPATSETLIFQKIGCESCYVGASVDVEGNYSILVGDGSYKLIVRNPSSPDVDLLDKNQERVVHTGGPNSENSVIHFDINIRLPE
jgi:hypothetical protein